MSRVRLTIQGTALWSVHRALGVHCGSKRGETDGHTQRYKDPPVPRRLVGESQVPPHLSPAYPNASENVPRSWLAGECRKIRTGTKAGFQLCRLPVRPQVRSDPTYTGPVAEPSKQTTGTALPNDLSGPGVHVIDRFINSHGKTGSFRTSPHETNTMACEKQLESTRIPRKGDPDPQVLTPTFAMVTRRKECTHRPTTTPSKTCSANFYRRVKRRVGCSLKRTHCKRNLVPAGKQAAYKLPRTRGSFYSFKRVPRSLLRQDSTDSDRQHYSSVVHKQGRGHEVGHTLCSTVENLDLVYQESSVHQSPTHSRPTECGSRQAIQVRPGHPDRVVSPSSGLSSNMQQVASASDRPFCHQIQQQVASVRVTSTGHHGHCSGCTLSWDDLDAYAFPPAAILGKVVEKLQNTPCRRIILIAPRWPNMT